MRQLAPDPALVADLLSPQLGRLRRALTVLLIDMAYGTTDERRTALGIMRRLEGAKTRRAVLNLIGDGGEGLRRRMDRLAAFAPRVLRPLISLPNPDSSLVLWLWRDDLRHQPLWLLSRDRGLTVLLGAPVEPTLPGERGSDPQPEALAGKISPTGAASRGELWTDEIDIELVRLARTGLAYARARAVLVGRCLRYAVWIGNDRDLLGTSLVARANGQP